MRAIDGFRAKYAEKPAEVQHHWDEQTHRMNITYHPENGEGAVVVSIRLPPIPCA